MNVVIELDLTPTDKNEEIASKYSESTGIGFLRRMISERLEHPDGIRSCIAAYDSR